MIKRATGENEWDSTYLTQILMQFAAFLHAVGLGKSDSSAWTFEMPDGKHVERNLTATEQGGWAAVMSSLGIIAPENYVEGHDVRRAPLWLKNRSRNYWFEYLPETQTLFMQVNVPPDEPANPWNEFVDTVFKTINDEKGTRLVIDLRHNGGGYGYLAQRLVHKIIASPRINQPGRLFVLIGRMTQSAGGVFASELELETNAVFVGEPIGAHPNFFNSPMGRHIALALPGTDILFRVSSRWEQTSDPQDDRRFIAPDIWVELNYRDYASGRDPVLEAALGANADAIERYVEDESGRPLPFYFRWRRPSQRIAFSKQQWLKLKR
jgi:hypothetical protein